MNPIATVRKVANGYLLTSQSGQAPATLYAATGGALATELTKLLQPYL
jgi:hypothetical protein